MYYSYMTCACVCVSLSRKKKGKISQAPLNYRVCNDHFLRKKVLEASKVYFGYEHTYIMDISTCIMILVIWTHVSRMFQAKQKPLHLFFSTSLTSVARKILSFFPSTLPVHCIFGVHLFFSLFHFSPHTFFHLSISRLRGKKSARYRCVVE